MPSNWTALQISTLRDLKAKELPGVEARCRKRLLKRQPILRSDRRELKKALEHEVNEALTEGFQKATKERTANCIAYVFWQSMYAHLTTLHKPPLDLPAIAAGFGLSASNLSRWGRETLPSANKFFVAALMWSVDARELLPEWPTPIRRVLDPAGFDDIAVRAVALAVQQIRHFELGGTHEEIRLEELACVGALKRDGAGMGLLRPAGPNTTAIAKAIIERTPRIPVRDPARVAEIAKRWLLAYALFDEARPNWSFLHDY